MGTRTEKAAQKHRRRESLALIRMAARLVGAEREMIAAQHKFRKENEAYKTRLHALMRFDGAPPR